MRFFFLPFDLNHGGKIISSPYLFLNFSLTFQEAQVVFMSCLENEISTLKALDFLIFAEDKWKINGHSFTEMKVKKLSSLFGF